MNYMYIHTNIYIDIIVCGDIIADRKSKFLAVFLNNVRDSAHLMAFRRSFQRF